VSKTLRRHTAARLLLQTIVPDRRRSRESFFDISRVKLLPAFD
jgi:hypothetical protein